MWCAVVDFKEWYAAICVIKGRVNFRSLSTIFEGADDTVPFTPSVFLQETGLLHLGNSENLI